MAARRKGTADRARAARRRTHELGFGRPPSPSAYRRVLARASAIWLGHRSNLRIDYRWGGGDADRTRRYAAELVALSPDVILTSGTTALAPLIQVTQSVPIVFAQVPDPVGSGFARSMAHPGGNATGFSAFEYSLSGKWLELLKEIAPILTRVAVLRDPTVSVGMAQWGAIQAVAPSLGVELVPSSVHDAPQIERDVEVFSRNSNGGLIVTSSPQAVFHLGLIVKLAAQHRLPAVYYQRAFVTGGGLLAYGADFIDQYRRAAGYVDRVLKGEKPADLPVQAPTKYELVVNLKAAKAIGLTVSPSLLTRADEVIE